MADRNRLVRALLDRHGRTLAQEVGIRTGTGTPSPLFRLLCACLLASAPISADLAVRGARGLAEAGWTTARRMADSRWEDRARVLNRSGYARYDERTATMLGDTSVLLIDRYGGDLRRLRDAAERDPRRERALLTELKGIGDVGVDIFFREVQGLWEEVAPFADRKALAGARALGLPADAGELARLVAARDRPRLFAALAAVSRERDAKVVRAAVS